MALLADASAPLTWNLLEDLRQLFTFHFMVNAFRAGTIVAVVAATIGWFMVLRRQTFAGHTLALVGFPGAAAATWVGISATWGFFGFCGGAALAIAALPGGGRSDRSAESAGIGVVQAAALAAGFLFVALYGGSAGDVNALLFGSFLGITDTQVVTLAAIGVVAMALMAIMYRPLLFASIDAAVAQARKIPVRLLSTFFLLVLGLTVAGVSQITGALLVFALLVTPAATAQLLTARPLLSLMIAIGIAVAVTWLSLAFAYYSSFPIGFYVTSFAFAAYVMAVLWSRLR